MPETSPSLSALAQAQESLAPLSAAVRRRRFSGQTLPAPAGQMAITPDQAVACAAPAAAISAACKLRARPGPGAPALPTECLPLML